MRFVKCLDCQRLPTDHFYDGKNWHPLPTAWHRNHDKKFAEKLAKEIHVLVSVTINVGKA